MTVVAEQYTYVVGADTHARTHTYAVVEAATGRPTGQAGGCLGTRNEPRPRVDRQGSAGSGAGRSGRDRLLRGRPERSVEERRHPRY